MNCRWVRLQKDWGRGREMSVALAFLVPWSTFLSRLAVWMDTFGAMRVRMASGWRAWGGGWLTCLFLFYI